ncbi:hypothetical protein VNO77_12522 [Canavalia gladiata]|uniref:Uncharacterized protein n=1 Tax=Canavalia gladiata TaxID=3824 RepID=A0AAN9QMV3_CANGL
MYNEMYHIDIVILFIATDYTFIDIDLCCCRIFHRVNSVNCGLECDLDPEPASMRRRQNLNLQVPKLFCSLSGFFSDGAFAVSDFD